ncbi:MAG: hypothetical protein ACRCYX_05870 [Dermatophilaceae bacterium]
MGISTPPPWAELARHFADLRDGSHGGEESRAGKEAAFVRAVDLLDAPATHVLADMDTHLLHGTGCIRATGPRRGDDGGLVATWLLTWPEQLAAHLAPVSVVATFGAGFHHPHLRGTTVGEWPLNVDSSEQANELVPTLRAVAGAELHNLVFLAGGDWRIIPVTNRGIGDDVRAARRTGSVSGPTG